MIKVIKTFLILIVIFYNQVSFGQDIKILYKINESIITSHDVNKEVNYLISLNQNLKNLNEDEIYQRALQSLIREKIKKDEINKFYEIDYDRASKSKKLIDIIANFRLNLGFNTDKEFQDYLYKNNIEINNFKIKFIIEQFWNQLIFDKFASQVNIDKKIDEKVKKLIKENIEIKSYDLSEIVYSEKSENENSKKFKEIIESIKIIGFKDTALIHSISESSKLGGKIGWVSENQISDKILIELRSINIGEHTNKIITSGGNIILMINDIKVIKEEIDKDKETKKLIASKNRILNEYFRFILRRLRIRLMFKNSKPIIVIAGDIKSVFLEIFFKSFRFAKRPLVLIVNKRF